MIRLLKGVYSVVAGRAPRLPLPAAEQNWRRCPTPSDTSCSSRLGGSPDQRCPVHGVGALLLEATGGLSQALTASSLPSGVYVLVAEGADGSVGPCA